MADQRNIDTPVAGETARQQNMLRQLWLRRRLFGAVFGLTLVLTLVALIVVPVRYLATGSVIVAEQEFGTNNASAAWAQKIGDPADLESQLLVIRSPRVMRLAMKQPGVVDAATEECRRTNAEVCERLKTDSAAFVDYVQTRYSVGAVGRSRVINISYQSPLADVAMTMANALTTAFLDDQRAAGSNSRELAASWLWQELNQLDAQLREADAKIQAFRRDKGLMRGATAPISSERLTSISQQLSVAEAARADAAARLQEIKTNQSRSAGDAPSVLSSRSVADLKQQLTVISAQLASQSNVLGPRHPSLLGLERERALVEQRLSAEVGSIAASAQKTFDANDALVKSLKKQMETIKTEVGSATSDEASIESMVRSTEIKRQQYTDLYKRASELETERRVLLGSTRLVSLAELPNKPFFPKKIPFLAAGATIGFLLAFAAALFGDRVAPRRRRPARPPKAEAMATPPTLPATSVAAVAPQPTPDIIAAPTLQPAAAPADGFSELAIVTGVPILARMPVIRRPGPESPIGAILTGQSGLSLAQALSLAKQDRPFQDALRTLNAGLFAPGLERRKILVTSPGAGEGKTFLTLALAQYLAGTGRRVLAVECDQLSPTFETALALRSGPGLQDILLGKVFAGDAAVRTATANLDVIGGGSTVSGSNDLLASRQMSDFLIWSRAYDVVLIDGPSPARHIDIGGLAAHVDGVLFCMRQSRSSIGDAVGATSAIKAAGGKVLGIAMTMIKPGTDSARTSGRVAVDAHGGAT